MLLRQFLVVLLLLCGAQALEQKYKDLLLELHNDHRANEGASNMNELVWDDQLEAEAQEWADRCVFEHQMKERGENLAYDSTKQPETELTKSAFKSWFDEKNIYSFGQYSCGASCHYTQLVWSQTRRVGCGMTQCGYLVQGTSDAWYLVCFYDPKGNMNGEKPYEVGAACSKCRDDQTCDNGLCAGGEEPCEDSHENCDTWANQMNQCTQNEKFMKDKCALSCKFCKGGGGDQGGKKEPRPRPSGGKKEPRPRPSGGNSKGGNKGKTKKPKGKQCRDKNRSCEYWANRRECSRNPGYMKIYCPKSCNTCSDNTECYDKHGNCREWTERGECSRNPGWMHKYCTRSCGQCPGGNRSCIDTNNSCARWAEAGECQKNPVYMRRSCKKSCNTC